MDLALFWKTCFTLGTVSALVMIVKAIALWAADVALWLRVQAIFLDRLQFGVQFPQWASQSSSSSEPTLSYILWKHCIHLYIPTFRYFSYFRVILYFKYHIKINHTLNHRGIGAALKFWPKLRCLSPQPCFHGVTKVHSSFHGLLFNWDVLLFIYLLITNWQMYVNSEERVFKSQYGNKYRWFYSQRKNFENCITQ